MVTVTILCATQGASLYYTIDGSLPSSASASSVLAQDGDVVILNTIGENTLRCVGSKQGMLDSEMAMATYTILGVANKPSIYPNGGTFAGSVNIKLGEQSDETTVYYTHDGTMPTQTTADWILSGKSFLLEGKGEITLRAIAIKRNLASSSISEAKFNLMPKVSAPKIFPDQNVFSISASLSFVCDTPSANIFYTTDGSEPSISSLSIAQGEIIVVEHSGKHTVKAMATERDMLPSDITTKNFQILERCPPPHFSPSPGTHIGDLYVTLSCAQYVDDDTVPDWTWSGGLVYYTTDGTSTPTVTTSKSIPCGQGILLVAPGKWLIRAFVVAPQMSPSSILQYEYDLVRPSSDEMPIMASQGPHVVTPLVKVQSVQKGDHCSGRLVTVSNALGHFDVAVPSFRSDGRGCLLSLVSDTAKEFSLNMPRSSSWGWTNTDLSEQELITWTRDYDEQQKAFGCEIAASSGFSNRNGTLLGNVVASGTIVARSSLKTVHFGVNRNASFVVGYVTEFQAEQNFHSLVAGAGWLVRGGKVYLQESLSPDGDAEDLSHLPANFVTASMARQVLGHDQEGRLMHLYVEGGEGSGTGSVQQKGMTLFELADLAFELGFFQAISVMSGEQTTLLQNQTLLSTPSATCQAEGAEEDGSSLFRCESKTASIFCIHAMPPPSRIIKAPSPFPSLAASPSPSQSLVFAPSHAPSQGFYDTEPTPYPTFDWPSWLAPTHDRGDDLLPTHDIQEATSNSTISALSLLEDTLDFYENCTYGLSILLAVSLLFHAYQCRTSSRSKRAGDRHAEIEMKSGDEITLPHSQHDIRLAHVEPQRRSVGATSFGGGLKLSHHGQPNLHDADPEAAAGVKSTQQDFRLSPASINTRTCNTTSTRGWQERLAKLTLDVDSDSEDDNAYNNNNTIETVDFRRQMPQMAQASRRTQPSHTSNPKYSQVGVESDDEDNTNPFSNK